MDTDYSFGCLILHVAPDGTEVKVTQQSRVKRTQNLMVMVPAKRGIPKMRIVMECAGHTCALYLKESMLFSDLVKDIFVWRQFEQEPI